MMGTVMTTTPRPSDASWRPVLSVSGPPDLGVRGLVRQMTLNGQFELLPTDEFALLDCSVRQWIVRQHTEPLVVNCDITSLKVQWVYMDVERHVLGFPVRIYFEDHMGVKKGTVVGPSGEIDQITAVNDAQEYTVTTVQRHEDRLNFVFNWSLKPDGLLPDATVELAHSFFTPRTERELDSDQAKE